jgi:hypothetical protein
MTDVRSVIIHRIIREHRSLMFISTPPSGMKAGWTIIEDYPCIRKM